MTFDPTPSPQYEPLDESITTPGKTGSSARSFFSELLQTLLLAALLYFAIDAVFARVRVLNISMQPTLFEGNIVLVNKLAYKLGEMKTGDVVIFHDPNNHSEDFIKRLIGKPGDQVTVQNGEVYVNGVLLDEPYIAAEPAYTGTWQVPEDSIFVLGDNRNQSSDSHSWGFVPFPDVVGKALIVYWPLDEIKLITHHQPDVASANLTNN
ncbi:MAG TPA: signal peptidase I [Anaerolineaceae bacterium]|nr:signal peptidase I [Anaerolineaceae bacterium]